MQLSKFSTLDFEGTATGYYNFQAIISDYWGRCFCSAHSIIFECGANGNRYKAKKPEQAQELLNRGLPLAYIICNTSLEQV